MHRTPEGPVYGANLLAVISCGDPCGVVGILGIVLRTLKTSQICPSQLD